MSREFFEPDLGRMGGFGFAARVTADTLQAHSGDDTRFEVVFLTGHTTGPDGRLEVPLGSTRVVFGSGELVRDIVRWRRLRLDVLLTIDWHSSFVPVTRALRRTRVIVWSRDPRGSAAWETIASLRLPPGCVVDDCARPLEPSGATEDVGITQLVRRSARARRPVRVVFTDEFLLPRFESRFGYRPNSVDVLGTPVDPLVVDVPSAPADHPELPEGVRMGRPFAVFLGRLDPIKRPWVFAAMAAAAPEIEFVALGQQHLDRGWRPEPADNLHWLGHLDGAAKDCVLSHAVATVNTSIHEAIPLSLLESLHHATPVVACLDPGGVVSRFGEAVAPVDGDGLAATSGLTAALRSLVADPDRRGAKGRAGREWVLARHARVAFETQFAELLRAVGVSGR